MTIVDALIVGAVVALLVAITAAVAAYAGWKMWLALSALNASVKSLDDSVVAMIQAIGEVKVLLKGVSQDLALLRAITAPQMHVSGSDEQLEAYARSYAQQNTTGDGPKMRPVSFPSPVYDRFQVAKPEPDATKEDTDIDLLHQTEEEMVTMEQIDNLRQRGIEVEDSDTVHPGVTAESE
jgi:hypothetical protein